MTFLATVSNSFEHAVYAPSDRPEAPRLYVIFKGTVKYHGEALGPGNVFGERDFLLTGANVMYFRASCKTYLHADYLEPQILWALASDFPKAKKTLQRYVMREAFRQYLLRLGQEQIVTKRHDARGTGVPLPQGPAARLAAEAKAVAQALRERRDTAAAPSPAEEDFDAVEVSSELLQSITAELLCSKKVHAALRNSMTKQRTSSRTTFDSSLELAA